MNEVEQIKKKLEEIKLEAILTSMMAIYEGSAEWNKGYKAGAADMIIRLQKKLFPSFNQRPMLSKGDKKLKLKERLEAWWYLGDQNKTQKILFFAVFGVVVYMLIKAFLSV